MLASNRSQTGGKRPKTGQIVSTNVASSSKANINQVSKMLQDTLVIPTNAVKKPVAVVLVPEKPNARPGKDKPLSAHNFNQRRLKANQKAKENAMFQNVFSLARR